MPFCFKRKEPVRKAVRRLCCERLNDALTTLDKAPKLEAVHNVRKEIKKLRSILRLTRGEIGKKTFRRHNETLREAAHQLTAFRDAQVTLNAFDNLAKHFKRKLPARPFPEIKSALLKNCGAEEKKLSGSIGPLREILEESKGELGHLKIKSKGWKVIAPGLKKIYGNGRDALEALHQAPSEENFHEWRKRVKDLGHQLRLLCPANPHRLREQSGTLEKLGFLLGDGHDLFMLKEFVGKNFLESPHAETLNELIASRQTKLHSKAQKLGRRFYRQKPGAFCRRIGTDWKTWRKKK